MLKFLAGLFLGLTIGGIFFHYQVKKVDYYSNRIGYLLGRFDEYTHPMNDSTKVGCRVYFEYHLDVHPFGYTTTERDTDLKEFCQTFSQQDQSQVQ